MPASTFPTRSAPTSAPLVKIPPPSLAKIDIREAPKPKATKGSINSRPVAPKQIKVRKVPVTANKARPATNIPVTAPDLKARLNPEPNPLLAAWAVRTLALTETFMPIYPVAADNTAPTKNAAATEIPNKNDITTKINIPTTNIVLYCLFKYAYAPS